MMRLASNPGRIVRYYLALLALTSVLMAAPAGVSASVLRTGAAGSQEPANQPRPSQELTKESKEAANEEKGENEEFKRSASVRVLARLTGMSLEHAYWLAVLLNFAVIAGVVIWISRSKLPGVFRNRTQSIQKAMEEARKASEEANRRLSEIEARLARLDGEIGSMRGTAEQETAAEEARIREAAEEDTRKVVESAEQEIAAAAKLARRELKAFAAELAVSMARQQIRVDAPTDQALVQNFSEQLGRVQGNGSGKDDR
jgi:F-type H+-transporting ATPase subunit b